MTRRFVLALIAVALLAASVLAQPAAQARATVPGQDRVPDLAAARVRAVFRDLDHGQHPGGRLEVGGEILQARLPPAAKKGSCALTWNGTKTQPVPGPRYQGQIARLRQLGGDVMPTFGGFSAGLHRDRDRRLLHQRAQDRGRLRGGDQGLPGDQARHGCRGQLAGQQGGHRPAEQGDRAGRGVGPAESAGRRGSSTRCRSSRAGSRRTRCTS